MRCPKKRKKKFNSFLLYLELRFFLNENKINEKLVF